MEAARLAEVAVKRVRGWVGGYRQDGPALVIQRRLPDLEGQSALSFRDLAEVRLIKHFLGAGVSWFKIRRAAREAGGGLLGAGAAGLSFRTDGTTIFADRLAETGDRKARDLVANQYVLLDVLRQSFRREFDITADELLERWHPRAAHRDVFVDPRRGFGQPMVEPGVPTRTLAAALKAEQGVADRVARLYEVPAELVREAAAFELSLAA